MAPLGRALRSLCSSSLRSARLKNPPRFYTLLYFYCISTINRYFARATPRSSSTEFITRDDLRIISNRSFEFGQRISPGTALPTAPTLGGDGNRLGDVR